VLHRPIETAPFIRFGDNFKTESVGYPTIVLETVNPLIITYNKV
jgi:hypothetical protein